VHPAGTDVRFAPACMGLEPVRNHWLRRDEWHP